ncbi:MAG: VWA domain-containing protein [Pseudomonadota bacterium]
MKVLRFALLAVCAHGFCAPSFAAAIDAPPTAQAGSVLTLTVSGSGDPRDFVSVVARGTAEGRYGSYEYIAKPGQYKLELPSEAGDFEIRVYAAASPYATLLRRPIKLTLPTATVKAPASVAAGGQIEIAWSGPDNPRDYIAIGDAADGGRPYITYEYTRNGSPVRLRLPEQPGTYEVRYFLGIGDKIIARQTVSVGGVTATLGAPTQVAAGAKFKVSWTGPDNDRDFVTLVKAGAAEKTYERYEYTARAPTLELTAPDLPGAYELRYSTGAQYITLARAGITVGAITGTLTGPAQVIAGEIFKVGWKGPDNARNFITLVPKGAREGQYSSAYAYTLPRDNPVTLLAPLTPGDYELRYSTAEKYLTLAHADIKVTPAKNEPGSVAVTLTTGAKTGGAIEIILDASGSMLQKLGGQPRIDIAKATLTKLTSATIPAGTPFALRVFGREVDSCQTDLDVPVGPLNVSAVGQRIQALVAKNGARTPIGASLAKVSDDLKTATGEKLIVLVTDGEETCGGDPAAEIEKLRKAGVSTRVSIVGFALDDEKLAATFRRWSDAGGGAFFDAKDAAGLDKSLTEALRPGFDVVNAQGQVLASGLAGGDAVKVPSGTYSVRIKGKTATKSVVVKPKETANVAF